MPTEPQDPIGASALPSDTDAAKRSEAIIARCQSLGFAAAGISTLEPTRFDREFREWLRAGRHGEMAYLEADLEVRLHPARLLPHARAAIVVADLYAARGDTDPPPDWSRGRIARYAVQRDYHRVIKNRLHELCDTLRRQYPGAKFRSVVDTAPVLERELALRAGVGWVGKHTLIIHPRLGSYMFLGAVFTTLPLAPVADQPVITDHCGTCTRCIDACPTRAISPYSVDASRCISYLTIEHRSTIAPEFHASISNWIYGCDICQEVCPHNSPRPPSADVGRIPPEYATPHSRRDVPLAQLLDADDLDCRNLFRSTPMWRITAEILKRNAIVAAGNAVGAGHRELLARIEDAA